MLRTTLRRAASAAGMFIAVAAPLAAQKDYRNLDAGHPLRVADATPLEWYATDAGIAVTGSRSGGRTTAIAAAALAFGALPNLHVGVGYGAVRAPGGDTEQELGGELFYALTHERPWIPALALAGSVHERETGTTAGLTVLATRTLGLQRLHANAGRDGDTWWAGAALDRTVYRRSVLALLEVAADRPDGSSSLVEAGAGVRLQLTPWLVLDAAGRVGLTAAAPALGLHVGLTRSGPSFLSPRRTHGRSARAEQVYARGPFNWRFLRDHPEAGRLFNAFDYGHAVLYEVLVTRADSAETARRLAREYTYLTQDLLVNPPRFAVAEDAIAPAYARIAWRAKLMFDWAHVLHRQIYDILATPGLDSVRRHVLVEAATDYYLSRRELAFTTAPKDMALMDEQYYSQVFRRRHAAFNGLIWAYHWLQVGLYEPLLADTAAAGRHTGIAAALAHFRAMLADPPRTMPQVMPMTPAIAPRFTARHPRAAAIFDNLHMLHDIISDVLAADTVPRGRKAAVIAEVLREFQDPTRNVMTADHWLNMAEHMGGVDAMGGAVPEAVPVPERRR